MRILILRKKGKHIPIFSVFVCRSDVVLMCIAVSLSDVHETLVTHKHGVVFIRVAGNHEVGFIVKPAVALATKPKFVLIPFRSSKRDNLFTGVELVAANSNKSGGSSPIVSSSSSCRHFVRRCLSQVATIWVKEEKVFQFYSTDSVKWRIIKKLEKGWSHVKNAETDCMLFLFVSRVSGPPFRVRSLLRSHRRLRPLPCWSQLRSHSFWREVVERVGWYTPRGG